jgi:hypothetical protein
MYSAAILAVALSASSAGAAPYRAEPVTMPAKARVMVRDTLWNCGGEACVGSRSNSRPEIVCALLVKRVGPLRSFQSAGTALPPEALEACNARAD